MKATPIGAFDSGLGGLSVLRQIRLELPDEPVLYLADQVNVPYGPRPLRQVQEFSEGITRFLLAHSAKLIVVACNTASAAALQHLRKTFPDVPFVGMEPAVKPAAATTRSKVVGVLATPATFQGELFASVVERFAGGVEVIPQTLPGLVERIEAGDFDGEATRDIVRAGLEPLLQRGVDTLVLGCTHYPFIIPLIQELAGPMVQVIDPSPAIARQVGRLLAERGLSALPGDSPPPRLFTTGEPRRLAELLPRLLPEPAQVEPAVWQDGRLLAK